MTDAERIAAHLTSLACDYEPGCTADDVQRRASTDDNVAGIMTMLSDVRREERDAWEAVLDEEIGAAVAKGELIASSRLARIKIRMKVRGNK